MRAAFRRLAPPHRHCLLWYCLGRKIRACQQRIVSMKLTRLRLQGFKSFVEPTDFVIEPGLTGVVGPNGCGKSNLVEALRWAMGETSHKSLRAADMDAVISPAPATAPRAITPKW